MKEKKEIIFVTLHHHLHITHIKGKVLVNVQNHESPTYN